MTDVNQKMDLFETRLFMPSWWVRAFDFVGTVEGESLNAIDQAWHMKISPAMPAAELNALSAIISSAQSQILTSNVERIRIEPADFQKHAATKNFSKLYAFSKVLQGLPGMRLLVEHDEGYKSIPLFRNESWERCANRDDGFVLEISLEPIGSELLLGYSNSHLEMIRYSEGNTEVRQFLRDEAPLSLWRAAWTELMGLEQSLLLRFEKAMQWECRWLHFEGIFGKNIHDLFAGLQIKERKRKGHDLSTKYNKLSYAMEKLGRKLCHQGLLRFDIDDEYLALSEKLDSGPLLLWQTSAQRAFAPDNDIYRRECLRHLQSNILSSQIDSMISFLLANVSTSELKRRLRNDWNKILKVDPTLIHTPVGDELGSIPVMAAPLFMEWSIRKIRGHKFPLEPELANSPAALFADLDGVESVEERFSQFAKLLIDQLDYRSYINNSQMASLSSMSARKDGLFREYAESYDPASVILSKSVAPPIAASKSRPMDKMIPDIAKKNRIQPSNQMRKLASQELLRMRSSDPTQYSSLRQEYISSLDDTRRKLILDVQSRMSSEHFDSHLKHSLIKYMIENPLKWTGKGQQIDAHQRKSH